MTTQQLPSRTTPDPHHDAPAAPGRLLRLVAAAPKRTLLAVFLFVLVAGFFGGPVAGQLESGGGFTTANADSVRAVERISGATGRAATAGVVLLVDTPGGVAADSDRIAEVTAQLAAEPGVVDVTSPTTTRGSPAGLVSTDGTQVLVLATLDAAADEDAVGEDVIDTFDGQDDVAVGGSAVVGVQLGSTIGEDLGRAEMMAFPILLLLSLLFFRGRAAVLPLVVGATTVLGTFLVISGINQLYGMSVFALNLVIGLGLGLAIDYTLFLVTRYREELGRQGATLGALTTTMRSAGRTVAFSATTVAVALAALTVFPLGFIKSMGLAGAVVAVVAAVAALVVSPALFALWGAELARKESATPEEKGRWYRLSHAVMRRPGAVAVATGVVMLALAAPALRAEWTPVDSSVIPTDKSARTVADATESSFGGTGGSPVLVAVEASDPAAVTTYTDQVAALPGVVAAADPVQLDATTWQLDLVASGDPEGAAARQLVQEARDVSVPGVDALVGGGAAEFIDQQDAIGSRLPLAAGLVIGLTLLVLWLMTGSVVLPVKAVIMNGLTVAASLGVLTFIYQDGRLTGLLGYTPNGGIEPTDFLITATLIFALSTDYGVFLLGRIKELRDGGLGERESVAVGVQRTGAVVTAAAILLAVAIGAFSTSSISFIQQIGVATAFGVLVDAFIVRSLLVPALMGLLGKYNWWAPMPLRRLHDRIGVTER
ncbi:MMPL family transporter [Nocardioides anomalus]|uniref:MMPL family transporter n=1 Tax=Nocardioides anomalus TaxID=2712223 RepID=A0A6G6WHG4_9ACTN|nr:MMPL family transporter [Nocardioides anomalus]QIG44768.1 MMPL family transporter [Nocardioides anomalus]